ncbi:(2Fe-2S)-binding protein [Rubrivirga sp. IMCC45206]|uniref:(2Fe-2S)-binding protein n=1 Tax=Rubrivirga sp. IMCC45206 TaxID=3391614 RepID=UPI00398FFF58
MTIDRCLCFDRTFASLADVAAETGARTIPDLQANAEFGLKCQLCHPYVRRMLRTGETVFHRVVTEVDEPDRLRERGEA